MAKANRTALLIRCSVEEAEKIRASAMQEHRTISAHVLKIVLNRIELSERIQQQRVERILRGRGLPLSQR